MSDYICQHQKEAKLPEPDNQEKEYLRLLQKELSGREEIILPYLCEITNKMCVGYENPEMMPEIETMRRCPSFKFVGKKKLEEQIKQEGIAYISMLTGASSEEIKSLEGKSPEEGWNILMEATKRMEEEAAEYKIET